MYYICSIKILKRFTNGESEMSLENFEAANTAYIGSHQSQINLIKQEVQSSTLGLQLFIS